MPPTKIDPQLPIALHRSTYTSIQLWLKGMPGIVLIKLSVSMVVIVQNAPTVEGKSTAAEMPDQIIHPASFGK